MPDAPYLPAVVLLDRAIKPSGVRDALARVQPDTCHNLLDWQRVVRALLDTRIDDLPVIILPHALDETDRVTRATVLPCGPLRWAVRIDRVDVHSMNDLPRQLSASEAIAVDSLAGTRLREDKSLLGLLLALVGKHGIEFEHGRDLAALAMTFVDARHLMQQVADGVARGRDAMLDRDFRRKVGGDCAAGLVRKRSFIDPFDEPDHQVRTSPFPWLKMRLLRKRIPEPKPMHFATAGAQLLADQLDRLGSEHPHRKQLRSLAPALFDRLRPQLPDGGRVSTDALRELELPARFSIRLSRWTGSQRRHRSGPHLVIRLDAEDLLDELELKYPRLGERVRYLRRNNFRGWHPTSVNTIAWLRLTVTQCRRYLRIEESQLSHRARLLADAGADADPSLEMLKDAILHLHGSLLVYARQLGVGVLLPTHRTLMRVDGATESLSEYERSYNRPRRLFGFLWERRGCAFHVVEPPHGKDQAEDQFHEYAMQLLADRSRRSGRNRMRQDDAAPAKPNHNHNPDPTSTQR